MQAVEAPDGLANMQARAQMVGGTVRYEFPSTGSAVVVNLPLSQAKERTGPVGRLSG